MFGKKKSESKRKKIESTKEEIKQFELVNSMSNWQRKQWARAGYPHKLPQLKKFANMERRDV